MIIVNETRGLSASAASGYRLDVGRLVEGHDGDLAVVAAEPEGRLGAVQALPAPLHPAHRPDPLALDDARHLRPPLPVAHPDDLGDADAGAGLEPGFRGRGDHRTIRKACAGPEFSSPARLCITLVRASYRARPGVGK